MTGPVGDPPDDRPSSALLVPPAPAPAQVPPSMAELGDPGGGGRAAWAWEWAPEEGDDGASGPSFFLPCCSLSRGTTATGEEEREEEEEVGAVPPPTRASSLPLTSRRRRPPSPEAEEEGRATSPPRSRAVPKSARRKGDGRSSAVRARQVAALRRAA